MNRPSKIDLYAAQALHAKAWGCSLTAHIKAFAQLAPRNLRQWTADQILLKVVCLEYGVSV